MTIVKQNNVIDEVSCFIAQWRSTPRKKITLHTSLFHDLGVDGDDASELLADFSGKFNVDISCFEFDLYFGAENSASILNILSELITNKRFSSTPRLEISDLVEAANTGTLICRPKGDTEKIKS